ncbi:hypothetical protein BC835DRAFT_1326130 [Cytidiella melzeri]|nr:hypothetical protein BC835DRAFT_1326130 [Cytidiella melzeri]
MRVTPAATSASAFLLALLHASRSTTALAVAPLNPLTLYIVEDNEIVGPLWVNETTGAAKLNPITSVPNQAFTIDSSNRFLDLAISGLPHAYISFANTGAICGESGPLVFTTSDSNKCSQQPTFDVTSTDELVTLNVDGSFQVCGPDNHIEFGKQSVEEDCVPVELVTQSWTS